ncbi:MAG: hypothetical protein AAF726_13480 [Planctomycetota bacterium]
MPASIQLSGRRRSALARSRVDRLWPVAAVLVPLAATSCGGSAPPAGPGDVTSASAPVTTGGRAEVVTSSLEASETLLPAGWDAPPPPSARPGVDLSAFVPNDAVAYLEFRSIDSLEEALRRFSAVAMLSEQPSWTPIDAMQALANAGIDLSRVDRSAPFAIALAPVPGEFVPGLVLIVPAVGNEPIVHSVSAMKARRMDATRADGNYVILQHEGMPTGPETTGSAAVTSDVPGGVVRGRVAVSAIRPIVAPYVRDLSNHVNEQYRLARPYVSDRDLKKIDPDALLDLLDVSTEIAFGVELVHDQVDLELRLVDCDFVKERRARGHLGRTIDTRIVEQLSHHIEIDDALSMVFAFDRETMIDEFEAGYEDARSTDIVRRARDDEAPPLDDGDDVVVTPRIDEESLATIRKEIERMLASFEPAAAFSMSLEPAKAHLAVYFLARDPVRARESISLLLSKCDLETWGFEMALPIKSELDGIIVEDYKVRFDTRRIGFDRRAAMREAFNTFLGASTLHVKVATSGEHVLLLIGGDTMAVKQRIRAFSDEAAGHPTIVHAVERATRGEAATVVHTDFVELLSQIAGLAAVAAGESVSFTHRTILREVGSDPAEFTFWSAVDGDDEMFGATFNLGELARAFEAFKGSGL